MPGRFDFRPGVYRVINARGLQVRGTMDTSHNGNLTGQTFTAGKNIPVFRVLSDKKGWMWGVITPADVPAPQTLFVCLWDLNTVFADLVTPFEESSQLTQLLTALTTALVELANAETLLATALRELARR